jgi:hypothetical protein
MSIDKVRIFMVLTVSMFVLLALSTPQPWSGALNAAPACSTSASVSADSVTTGPFAGLWKYTISGSWNTGGEGLSHIAFLVTYACDCCDVNNLVFFDSPAGTSTGEDSLGNSCTANYEGLGDFCSEDPTIPSTKPALKFEQNDTGCEAVSVGSGTWCFYSPLPPLASDTYTNAVAVKYGVNVCNGNLVGEMPNCTYCETIPTENRSWGAIKNKYKK